jgi:hypothetical protein
MHRADMNHHSCMYRTFFPPHAFPILCTLFNESQNTYSSATPKSLSSAFNDRVVAEKLASDGNTKNKDGES